MEDQAQGQEGLPPVDTGREQLQVFQHRQCIYERGAFKSQHQTCLYEQGLRDGM